MEAQVIVADGVHNIVMMDVIEHQGGFWLVPEWLDNRAQQVTMPVRIVSLETLPHQRTRGRPEFVVNDPVPKYVFDGHVPPEQATKYIVVERPDIRIPLAPRLH